MADIVFHQMSRGDGSKRHRKNLNLSLQIFQKLESLKAKDSKKSKTSLSWNDFFTRAIERGRL